MDHRFRSQAHTHSCTFGGAIAKSVQNILVFLRIDGVKSITSQLWADLRNKTVVTILRELWKQSGRRLGLHDEQLTDSCLKCTGELRISTPSDYLWKKVSQRWNVIFVLKSRWDFTKKWHEVGRAQSGTAVQRQRLGLGTQHPGSLCSQWGDRLTLLTS